MMLCYNKVNDLKYKFRNSGRKWQMEKLGN